MPHRVKGIRGARESRAERGCFQGKSKLVKKESISEIVARIHAAKDAASGGAVAFDGDGTLWSGDVGEDFFLGMIEARDIRPLATNALRVEAAAASISDAGTGAEVARRLYDAYLAHRFDEERICEIMTWVAAEYTEAELRAFCDDLLVRRRLQGRLHEEVAAVVRFTKENAIDTFLVSASPSFVVEAGAKIAGISPLNVVAARAHFDGAKMAASVVRPIPYGPGKVTRLRERIGGRPLYAAFGDNAFDVPMLREATVKVAVRPKPRLEERAHEVPGLVQISETT